MQAILIYNNSAGNTDADGCDELLEALKEAGYDAEYRPTDEESDLNQALADADELVVVAGGDGTIRSAALRLLDHRAAIAPLPLGTANNICRSLGIEGRPLDLITRLAQPEKVAVDVGRIRAPWGSDVFLEACGSGLFADMMMNYQPDEGKSFIRAIGTIVKTLSDYEPKIFRAELDGKALDESLLLFEVLNTPATGPRLRLAPHADPSDGFFDVVCVHESNRVGFVGYMKNLLEDDFDELPNVEVHRVKQVKLEWDGYPLHLDAELRPREEDNRADGSLEIELMEGALEFWIPSGATGG